MIYDRNILIRRILYTLVFLLAALLQNTPELFPELYGVRAFLLLPAVVAVGMFERNTAGILFGAFAGILWDMSSSKDGFNAIVMFLFAFACGLMISYFMRNNAVTALVLTAACTAIYICLFIIVFYVFSGVGDIGYLMLRFYLPSFLYTLVFCPLEYFIIRDIYRYTDKPKRIKI